MSTIVCSSPRTPRQAKARSNGYVHLPFDPASLPFNYRDATFVELPAGQKLYHYVTKYCAAWGINSFRAGGAKVQTKKEREQAECNPKDKPDYGLRLGLGQHSFTWEHDDQTHHFILLHQQRDAHPGTGKDAVPIESVVLFLKETGPGPRELMEGFFNFLENEYNGDDTDTTKVYRSGSYAPKLLGRRAKRGLDTVFLPQDLIDSLVGDMQHFSKPETKARYNDLGIPYKRGYMFDGPPGTGKTSTIRALAGHTNRPVVLMSNLTKMSDQELITCINKCPKRSIIVLEDLDRLFNQHKVKKTHTGITTEGLLQVLDGIASPEGRITIITCNNPKVLPAALFRPGRVDKRFDFGLLSWRSDKAVFQKMVRKYHGHLGKLSKEDIKRLKSVVISVGRQLDGVQMSRMQEMMLKTIHMTSIDEVLTSLEDSASNLKVSSRGRESEMYA